MEGLYLEPPRKGIFQNTENSTEFHKWDRLTVIEVQMIF